MMSTLAIDSAHMRILTELQCEARLTNVELAKRIGLSESACLRKTKELEEAQIILGYRANVNASALGLAIHAIILVNLDQRLETETSEFFSSIAEDERVISCLAITGPYDLVLEAYVGDIQELSALTLDHLLKLPSVKSLVTCIALRSFDAKGILRPIKGQPKKKSIRRSTKHHGLRSSK